MGEWQNIEYKDFSKTTNSDKKHVQAKMFKEISAFANSGGGKIIVGIDDKSNQQIKQPAFILDLLQQDTLSRFFHKFTMEQAIFTSEEQNGIVTIDVQATTIPIYCCKDGADNLFQGDLYIRVNSETKKASAADARALDLKPLSSQDLKSTSHLDKMSKLRKIVNQKFTNKQNDANNINIFDALCISVSDKSSEYWYNAETLFDVCMLQQFCFGFKFPLSEKISISMHLDACAVSINPKFINQPNKAICETFRKISYMPKLIDAWRQSALDSNELDSYLAQFE